jgi:TP901 family phage tail tape measure protein
MSSTKTYQVDYLIRIQDEASNVLAGMATKAETLATSLGSFKESITKVVTEMRNLSRDFKGEMMITPQIDKSAAAKQFADLEKLAAQSAKSIATIMNSAFTGNAPKTMSKADIKKAIDAKKEELKVSSKQLSKHIQKEIDDLNAQLKSTGKKSSKSQLSTINSLTSIATQADKMGVAAKTVTALNKSLNKFDAKSINVKINADTTPALTAFNTLLKTIRETAATVPITITNAANQANKGTNKAKSKASKVSSKTDKSAVENVKKIVDNSATTLNKELQKKQNAVAVKVKLDKVGMVSQLNTIVSEIKAKAATKPVSLKVALSPIGMVKSFNQVMGELKAKSAEKPLKLKLTIDSANAVVQLEKVIATLQELANTKAISLKATASTASTTPTGTAPPASAKNNAAREAEKITQGNISAYQRHAESMSQLRIDKMAAQTKERLKEYNTKYAQKQAMYESLFGREALHQKWLARDEAGLSTRAKNNAARRVKEIEQRGRFNKYMARNSSELARIYGLNGANRTIALGSGNSYYPTRMAAPQSLYARARTFWYPFTGNTSFGARTPMAVDMAKGMGTMFAIGGAMSAVGSSLSQSVSYQNIMATTQAILKNGTSNYSADGFKDMAQVVRQVGKKTKFTAPQVASAAKFLAMAGYDIPSIKHAINPVANIALIGDTDLGETADKLTNVMTTFGINPEKMNDIADIMTSTFTRSNTDMMMLAESAKYAGGIAHLYGGNFKNNFSDVMAMFGALGNAGIQASSAGTTLRMMYQNLMQPNKNQKKTLQKYGIVTRDSSGAPLEMVDILKQIRAKVPQNQLADAIGNMFRITAQPGAAALVNAIKEPGKGGLIDLMEANRNAAGSGVAQSIADEKENTLSGLWAQVQSTFTEGILQAVEGRQGGWAGMLMQLRDYLAKPETVQMLSSIVDLVEKLMSIIGEFAQVYAKVYTAFPNLINFWMRFQLYMTQLGYLVTPIIQLLRVLDMFNVSLLNTAAAATTATVAEKGRQVTLGGNTVTNVVNGAATVFSRRRTPTRFSNVAGGLVAALRSTETGVYTPAILPLSFGFGNKPIYRHGRELVQATHTLPTVSHVMPFHQYAPGAAAILSGGKPQINMASAYRERAHRWGEISAFKSISAEQRAAAAMRSEQYLNAAITADMLRQQRIADIATKRHANRVISSDVIGRYASSKNLGFRKTAGLLASSQFSAGRALGTLSMASMFGGLKNMTLSLFGGLAKAIGLLVSPVGLAIAGITALASVIFVAYKRNKEYSEQMKANAEKYSQSAQKARQSDLKLGKDLAEKMDKELWGNTPPTVSVPSSIPNVKQHKGNVQSTKIKYQDALDASQGMADANRKWIGHIMSSRDARLGFGNDINKYLGKNLYFDTLTETYGSTNAQNAIATVWAKLFAGKDFDAANNKKAADARARTSLIYRGAIAKSTIDAREKVVELYKQYQSKKIDKKAFESKAQEILNSVANPNAQGLLSADNYSAQQIAESDPTKFKLYQQGAYNAILAEIQGAVGSYVGQIEAIKQLKNGVALFSNKWYNAVAHIVDGMNVSIQTIKGNITATLKVLPNGQIDTASIIAQIRQKVSAFKLTMTQFANLVAGVYSELIKSGLVKGNYYSNYIKYTTDQTKHMYVTADDAGSYFDTYIAKGDAKATWKGMNKQEYVKYITNTNNKDDAAQERAIIRGKIARNAAISAKRNTDKLLETLGQGNDKTTDKDTTNGTNGSSGSGDDKKKNQKDYASSYDRSAARPTQVVIQIENLANFDRTAISKDSNERAITEAIENKIADAVSMLSAQILSTASNTISQGLT